MDEEEEMWFNEDDEFDDNEAIVPAATNDILSKKLDTDLESIGKIMDKKADANGPKMNNNSMQKATVLNNNPSTGTPSSTPTESKSALFKRVSVIISVIIRKKTNKFLLVSTRGWWTMREAIQTRKMTRPTISQRDRACHSMLEV